MRVTIFSCHHMQPIFPRFGDLFVPIWTGGTPSATGQWLTDLGGINLHNFADLNEMRQEFFVWRNLLSTLDYVGFEHYGRLFLLDPHPAQQCQLRYPRIFELRRELAANSQLWRGEGQIDTFPDYIELRSQLTHSETESITDWIRSYDIITPRRHTAGALDEQWRQCGLSEELWQNFISVIGGSSLVRQKGNFINFSQIGNLYCNMFIMRAELFDEYMKFWSEVIFSMQGMVERPSRLLGFLSERLFSLWVQHKQIQSPLLRIAELPYALCLDVEHTRRVVQASGVFDTVAG